MLNKKSRSRKHQSAKKSRLRKHTLILKNKFVLRFLVAAIFIFLTGSAVMFAVYLRNDIIYIARGSDKNEISEGAKNKTENNIPAPSAVVDIKISSTDHMRGNKKAKILIIGFADFQCPFSLKFYNVMHRVMKNYPNKVKWVYKHFPLSSHKYARKAAEASECAGEQNKFWEFTDKLFENQPKINDDYVLSTVKELGINVPKFEKCLSEGKYADKVNNDYKQGKDAGVTGSPGIIINKELINGAVTYGELKKKIEKNLKQ